MQFVRTIRLVHILNFTKKSFDQKFYFALGCTANNAAQGTDWKKWNWAEKLGRTFEEYLQNIFSEF